MKRFSKWSPERLKLCTKWVLEGLLAQAEGNAAYSGSKRHFVWAKRAEVVKQELAQR
jgi:hypothetical protein